MDSTMYDPTPHPGRPTPDVVRVIAMEIASRPPAEEWGLLSDLVRVSWPTLEAHSQ
jgi:hypothetical protein